MNEMTKRPEYPVTDDYLALLEQKAGEITVADHTDKEAAAKARTLRLEIKESRVKVEKIRKALKADALKWGQIVDGEARRIRDRLEPLEARLQEQEDVVRLYEEREAKRKAEEEAARIEAERQAEIARIAEEQRKIEEERAKIEAERQAEQERIEAERRKIQAEREAFEREKLEAERQRIAAEQARIRAEQERIEAERRADQERIDAERRKVEAERAEAERIRMEAERAEAERLAKIEADRIAEEQRLEAERMEAERKAAEIAARPDWQKLADFCDELWSIPLPQLTGKPATVLGNLMREVRNAIVDAQRQMPDAEDQA